MSSTTATFFTALIFNASVFGIEIGLFTVLRRYFKQIYEPRTQVLLEKDRVPPLKSGILTWPIALLKKNYRDVQQVNGPDAYFFVRFLRMMIRVLLPIWFISWIVLIPLTTINNSIPGQTGLDRFTFGSISPVNQNRYIAHVVLAYIFTFWIFWNIRREMLHFTEVRQLHLMNPAHSNSVQANTILVTGVPAQYLTESKIRKLYSHLPGKVEKVWFNRNLKDLPYLYDRRLAACEKLESAETSLLSTAAKLRQKALKQANSSGKPFPVDSERDLALAERLVPRDKWPSHRLRASFMPFSFPFIGEKVNTIDWCRKEIATTTASLIQGRKTLTEEALSLREDINGVGKVNQRARLVQTYPHFNSAFITFSQQITAHLAFNTLAHHKPYCMADRYLEVSPPDVIWSNLGLNPYEKRVRMAISYAATAALIICWSFPVAFIGVVSNIQGLCVRESWLSLLCSLPSSVVGILQGILPPLLLAVLMLLLPVVLRLLGRFEGIPTRTGIELSLMTRFFAFHVIHSFLIVTLSSGIVAALPSLLQNPSSIPALLAEYLPQASTFFMTYIMLQGFSGTAGSFLNAAALVLYYVKLSILASTPRSVYNIKYAPITIAWGMLFPSITLLVVITIAYSIISPLINGIACCTFFLFYLLFKYLFLYRYTQPPSTDTGGLFFPKAMQHVIVGMYLQQICLFSLFFLARDQNSNPSAIPEAIMIIVLIALTVGCHVIINDSFGPIIRALPLSLADKTYSHAEPSMELRDVDGGSRPKDIVEPSNGSLLTGKRRGFHSPWTDTEQLPSDYDNVFFARKADGTEDYGFAHPAVSRPQRIVWIPDDLQGLGRQEVRANVEAGVKANTLDATMDEGGKVNVTGPPDDLSKF